MTTARIESLVHRTFLTIPVGVVILSLTLYPYLLDHWDSLRNFIFAFYTFALVFLKTAAFDSFGREQKVAVPLHTWILGAALTFDVFISVTNLHTLLDLSAVLRLL